MSNASKRWRATSLLVVATLLGPFAAPAVAQEQELALSTRGPRFLMASRSPAETVEIDARQSPLLRRRVSLHVKGANLRSVLHALSTQANVKFVFDPEAVPVERPVTLQADGITLAGALLEILLDTDLDVLLLPSGRQVALVKRASSHAPVPAGRIVGRVTDGKSGVGLPAADVLLGGTRWRTTTDSSGRYTLADVDSGAYTLTVRRLGYARVSRRVTVREGETDTVDVALAPVATQLDSLVTTATGRQRRRDLGNDITTIQADSVMRTAPIRDLTDLLQDRVPGLTTQHTSGAPGDPARLRLRGLGSVLHASDPVVVVDGVRIYAAQSEARSGNLTNALGADLSRPSPGTDVNGRPIPSNGVPAPSPLDQIDPNVIEKVEVFKGPSAATMYGADAANGVIVITTKRGKPGPTRWDASLTRGWTNQPGVWPTGYYRFGHDMYNGRLRFCALIDVQCVQDSLVQFQALNQQALTVLGGGQRTGLSLTASGGTSGTRTLTYSVTGSYADETGLLQLPDFEVERFRTMFNRAVPDWMQHPHHLKTWSVSSNVTALLGSKADVTLSTSLARSEQQRTSLENQLAPLSGTYIDTVNARYFRPANNGYAINSTSAILNDYYVHTTASAITVHAGLNGNWRPRSWLTATGQAGLDLVPRDDHLLLPAGLISTYDSGTAVRGTGRSLVSTVNLQGTARKSLPHGLVFETNLGTNVTTTSTSDLSSSATGLVPGTTAISGARRISALENSSTTSVFGWYIEPRLTGRTIAFSSGVRIDGGSAYGARITGGQTGNPFSFRNLFGLRSLLTLPKLGGSWVVSDEPFFPFKSLFSSLRLRGAYGQAQVQPSATDRLRLYTGSLNQFGQILTLTTVGNTHLRPERSTEFEGGFDADVLDSRVSVTLTGYRKMQVDALMNVTLPGSINGGGSSIQNIGNIRNTGLELKLAFTPLLQRMATWNVELNYSHNANTLVKLGQGVDPNPAQGLVEGYPVGGRWARPIIGYADQNGDGVLQPQEVRIGDSLVYMGRLYPNYTTSLFSNLAFFGGALRVGAGFNYQAGVTQVDQTARTNWVLARALVDPSVPLNQQAAVLALNQTDYGLVQTISTFRFNSLSVNYRAPTPVARLLRAEEFTVGLQGANLAMHSTYRGKDPDVNAWGPGENIVDTGQLPLPRTWQLAVFLRF